MHHGIRYQLLIFTVALLYYKKVTQRQSRIDTFGALHHVIGREIDAAFAKVLNAEKIMGIL